MRRVFEATVKVVVDNNDVDHKNQMKFTVEDVKKTAEEIVLIDIDTQEGTSVGNNDENRITTVYIEWENLKERQ